MLDLDHVAVVYFGDRSQNIDLLTQRSSPPNLVVFVCCFEWEWYATQGFRECAQYAQQHGIEIVAVTGGNADVRPTDPNRMGDILPCVSAESYPLYWITNTVRGFQQHNPQWYQRINHIDPQTHQDLFVSINNKPHDFRCMQMDMLEKYNLIHCGKISWDTLRDFDGRTAQDAVDAYDWQYWNPDQMMLEQIPDHFQGKRYGWNGMLPNCYKNCSIHLVMEATTSTVFFTEKVVPPLMTGKMFLAIAATGFHQALKDQLGFELYDEVFDYAFDQEPDPLKRAEAIARNINQYRDYNANNWVELYKLMDDKITHNLHRLREIVQKPGEFMPQIVQQLCEHHHPEIQHLEIYHHYIQES